MIHLYLTGTSVAGVDVTRDTAEECFAVALATWGGIPDRVVIEYRGEGEEDA